MDLKKIYESSDINTIFDEIGELTGIDPPAVILLPIRQIRYVELGKDDTIKVEVALITRKERFDIISINPGEVESLNLFEKFGLKNNERLSKENWDRCLNIFFKLSPTIPETIVYRMLGSIPGKNEFVFADKLITANSCAEVENSLIKGKFPVQTASAEFFFNNYIPVFNDKTNGLIFLFTLLLSTGLSRLSEISIDRPAWVVAVIAESGSYKTSTVNAALNPFQTANCTSMSFEASISVIIKKLMDCRDTISIIDDYYTNADKEVTSKLESIIRLNGDVTSGRQRMSGKKYIAEDCHTISIITGEILPKVRFSSKPRMLVIDFKTAVNADKLSELQKAQPKFRGALVDFIQYSLSNDNYIKKLITSFETHRREIHKEKPGWHGRYKSMCAWYLAMYYIFCEYCKENNVSYESIQSFPEDMRKFIANQSKSYLECDTTYIFFKTLGTLVDQKKIKAIPVMEITNDTPKTDIIYNDDCFWLESTSVYEKILQYCISEGIVFGNSRIGVYRKLSEDGLLIPQQNGKLTGEYRKGKFRESTVCFGRNNIRRYFSYGSEVENK